MRANAALPLALAAFEWPGIAASEARQTPTEICLDYKQKVADAETADDRMQLVNELVLASDTIQIEHRDLDGAIALLECRLTLIKQHPTTFDGSPSAAITQDIAGDAFSHESRFAEAAERYRLAIAGYEAVSDMEGFAATAMMKRAIVLVDAGRHDEAEAQMKSTVMRMITSYGADSEMTELARKQLQKYRKSRPSKQE